MNRFSTTVALVLGSLTMMGQTRQDLPHTLAPDEVPLIPAYRDSRANAGRGIVTPPTFTPRTMAEWEEIQTLVITWTTYPGILKQIVRAAKEECEVLIVCSDQNSVTSYLQNSSNGGPITDLDNITFLEGPYNSVWTRDFGPECIYENEVDSLYLLDWIYNRPRPQDDAMSDIIGTAKGINVYSSSQAPYDLVHTGGNFMADGFGTAFSSELVLDENGPNGQYNQTVKTTAQVKTLMDQWMGITPDRYVLMNTLPYDVIHHIDMHMKLIDEETLLIGEFPVGQSDGPQMESNLQAILADHNSVFGTPYRIVRVPMPSGTGASYPPSASYRTYANNVFVNKTVIVPTYREEYDTTGLRILAESLPGYTIVPIDCDNSPENIISASGAIHCITKGIGVNDPLLIRHQRLTDTYETVVPYQVEAYIRHRSGIASAEMFWTTDLASAFNSVPMVAGANDNWSAAIPAQAAGTVVYYYIHATANSGKQQVRPIVAPDGWWKFRVLDIGSGIVDAGGPVITEVFPNPTSSILAITLADTGGERVLITLRDALGREVMRIQNGPMHQDQRAFADLTALAEGAYMLVVESAKGRSTTKVLKN
ncbi:MAG: agmatine deiminase family protein [Flavobacteriales bacterium]|nr:agmatine deiminase family protein [Flavobacteriales bacterium]